MIRGILRYMVGRRLARFLPGGWLVLILTSGPARRALLGLYGRLRRR